MCALPAFKPVIESQTNNVIQLHIVNGQSIKKQKLKKDGTVDNRHNNKVAGISSEVYPYVSEAEIKAMVDVFNKRIDEAKNDNQKMIAHRNKMLFLIGINLGIRASDLCGLKYSFFMNDNGTFKDSYKLQPKKTKKTGKFVTLHFNQAVKKAIADYIEEYPVEDFNEYLFKSRKGDGYITEKSLWKIVVDATAEAGINRNVGSHTLRKTFGRFVFHNAVDKSKALVVLQTIFNHSSPAVTSKYIGLTDDEVSDVFNELNLGIDYI